MIDTLKEPKTSRAPSDSDGRGASAVLDTFAKSDSAGFPPWLRTIRASARARAAQLGFPTTRLEEWKFTNPAADFAIAASSRRKKWRDRHSR